MYYIHGLNKQMSGVTNRLVWVIISLDFLCYIILGIQNLNSLNDLDIFLDLFCFSSCYLYILFHFPTQVQGYHHKFILS